MAHVSNQSFEENVEKSCSASNFTSANLNCALHADDVFVGPDMQIYKFSVKNLSESCYGNHRFDQSGIDIRSLSHGTGASIE